MFNYYMESHNTMVVSCYGGDFTNICHRLEAIKVCMYANTPLHVG